jgi:catechol 2,3-dioxygenase-like lactoylglutathione lyase family enzyme
MGQDRPMELQLSMVVLEVADLEASVRFYRRLGLEIPDAVPGGRPVVAHRMGSGVTLLLTTGFASTYDPTWSRPSGGGYSQLLEFYVGEDAVVDSRWNELVGAGYVGRMPPTQTFGPYAAIVEDPDGNAILLTSDEAASPDS